MRKIKIGAASLAILLASVLTLSSQAQGQVVERGRTLADLIASHPCDTGLTNRIARVTDCDAADDFGNGGGAFQCWAYCDGSAPWTNLAIGAGGGGGLSDADYGDVAVSGSGTVLTVEALRGGAVAVAATTGNLQWEGTTADGFEGNFTFADPTADWTWAWDATGNVTIPGNIQGPAAGFTIFGGTSTTADLTFQVTTGNGTTGSDMHFLVGNNGAIEALKLRHNGNAFFSEGVQADNFFSASAFYAGSTTSADAEFAVDGGKVYLGANMTLGWASNAIPEVASYVLDTTFTREASDVVKIDSLIELTPIASGGTCDAGNEGRIYNDSSHALCWCDGTTVQKLSGGGTCD